MTTYRETKGYSIKKVSSDPANVKEGQIWYNSSSKTIKIAPKIAAFASGGNLPRIIRGGSGGGTQTAAWYCGGLQYNTSPPTTSPKNKLGTLEYDGSSWTETNNIGYDFLQEVQQALKLQDWLLAD